MNITVTETSDTAITVPLVNEEIFDYRGLSAYLKIPEGTLRHWVMEKRLPFIKLGKNVRFSKTAIGTWLNEHTKAMPKQYTEADETTLPLFSDEETA